MCAGASEEQLHALRGHECSATAAQVLADAGATCPICLGAFCAGETLSCLPCGHEHHRACLVEWLRLSASCPMCKCACAEPFAGTIGRAASDSTAVRGLHELDINGAHGAQLEGGRGQHDRGRQAAAQVRSDEGAGDCSEWDAGPYGAGLGPCQAPGGGTAGGGASDGAGAGAYDSAHAGVEHGAHSDALQAHALNEQRDSE